MELVGNEAKSKWIFAEIKRRLSESLWPMIWQGGGRADGFYLDFDHLLRNRIKTTTKICKSKLSVLKNICACFGIWNCKMLERTKITFR